MATTEPVDLLLRDLSEILYVETRLLDMLPRLADIAGDDALAKGLQAHRRETEQQVANLQRAFELMEEEPLATPSPAMDGLEQEHETFLRQAPAQDAPALHVLGVTMRTEGMEMALYRSAIGQAESLGEGEVAELLHRNLRQEEAMAARAEEMTRLLTEDAADPTAEV